MIVSGTPSQEDGSQLPRGTARGDFRHRYNPHRCGDVIVVVEQFVDLREIRHVGRRTYHALHQARLRIHTNVSLHTEVPPIAFLSLVHLCGALAVLVLGRTRRVDPRGLVQRFLHRRMTILLTRAWFQRIFFQFISCIVGALVFDFFIYPDNSLFYLIICSSQ